MSAIVFATRPSALARWQTRWVIQALQHAWPGLECLIRVITTRGDQIVDRPLPEIGGKGLFTEELEAALLSGEVDAAVHSLKDLPVDPPPGLVIGAIPEREDPADVLVSAAGHTLDSLPPGALVGTSSLRRAAQARAWRPDVEIQPLRGNVDTRIRKARQGHYDAIVLAAAGVRRLGLEAHISQQLPLDRMLLAPGQGALAVQCRADDRRTLDILAPVESPAARTATTAERSFLAALGGGCSLPVGAYAGGAGRELQLRGVVAALDGSRLVRVRAAGAPENAHALGQEAARQARAEGAMEVLNV